MSELIEKICSACAEVFAKNTSVCPHDGTALDITLAANPVSLRFNDRYEIVGEIGRGGMGVIYKAVDHLDPQQEGGEKPFVAIKLLIGDSINATMRNRFINEAKAASSLSHPNIVKVNEYALSEDGLPYMVMEYLPGVPLQDLLDSYSIEKSEILHALIQVCDALSHAHWRNIIHRDIKPSNIVMLRANLANSVTGSQFQLKPVLVDFGIAKIFTQPGQVSQRLTQTGEVFGSPLYMSPEQCMGQKIDCRSDIYSMGCVLYECIAGRPPFEGNSFINLIFKHINEEPENFAEEHVDMVIESVIMKALAKDPSDRFATMQELKEQLEYCLALLTDETVNSYSDFSSRSQALPSDQLLELQAAASAGNANAQLDLAYYFTEEDHYDPEKALSWCLKAATAELAEAQAYLGDLYYGGTVCEQDFNMAFYWYSKAALAEHSGAEKVIGSMYLDGIGVEANRESALYWLRRAGQRDNVDAQYFLALLLHGGELNRDMEEAAFWYGAAAELGHAEAQIALANCYLYAEGVEQNPQAAVKWFEIASEQGNSEAHRNLGECYANGTGVDVDAGLALKHMKLAAEAGDAKALVWMGFWYRDGIGTARNEAEYRALMAEAAKEGVEAAELELSNLD